MGVDTELYIGMYAQPEHIATAVAIAAGVPPRLIEGKPNILTGSYFISKALKDDSAPTFWHITAGDFSCSLHLTHDSAPLGDACWLLTRRPAGGASVAVFRAVAEQLGGILVEEDHTSMGELYQVPECRDFTTLSELAYATKRVRSQP